MNKQITFNEWLDYATRNHYHSYVIDYLVANKQCISFYDDQTMGVPAQSWQMLSELLIQLSETSITVDDIVRYDLFLGILGPLHAKQFTHSYKLYSTVPSVDNILNGSLTSIKKLDLSGQYSLVVQLVDKLHDEITMIQSVCDWRESDEYYKWNERVSCYLGFIMNNFCPEIVIMSARIAFAQYKLPIQVAKSSGWNRFASHYQDLMLS